jgi:hypothetical protein
MPNRMRKTIAVLALAGLSGLAGCVEPQPDPMPPSCGAEGLQGLVGQREEVLASMTFGAGAVRVIRPGQAVTMDYNPRRINFELDGANRIVRVFCG